MSVSDELLLVQEHDSAADRLRHRRRSLPELVRLAAAEEELAAVAAAVEGVDARRATVAARQRRAEDELAAVEAKRAALRARLYSGEIAAPRELQAVQADVESLGRRCSTLEDEVLEAMTEREPLDDELAGLQRQRDRVEAEVEDLRAAVVQAQAAIDAELASVLETRRAVAARLPSDLLARYERLRGRLDGVGAARLVNGRCGGCHLALSATELDRIRRQPPDALVVCEQCDRILVR